MQYDRYYYSVLNQKEKEVYKLIYNGIENLDTSIKIPTKFCSGVDFGDIIQKILLDNPHIFYIDRNGYKFASSSLGFFIKFDYLYNAKDIAKLHVKINKVVNSMLKRITGETDYEKEKSVHDLICTNVTYTYDALDNMKKYSSVSNTILGVLFYKTAVCEGIALTVKLLLNMLDIKCIVAIGQLKNELHAWDIVKIDGQSYHLDVTNDLSEVSYAISYKYFNLTDKEILKTHTFLQKYPACNNSEYNYFAREKLIASSKADIERIVRAACSSNQGFVEFKFAGNTTIENARSYALTCVHATQKQYINDNVSDVITIVWGNMCLRINDKADKCINNNRTDANIVSSNQTGKNKGRISKLLDKIRLLFKK